MDRLDIFILQNIFDKVLKLSGKMKMGTYILYELHKRACNHVKPGYKLPSIIWIKEGNQHYKDKACNARTSSSTSTSYDDPSRN